MSGGFSAAIAGVGGIVVRCRGEAVRGMGAAARARFTRTADALRDLETATADLPRRLVLQRLRSAAASDEGGIYDPGFYEAAGDALKVVHAGGIDFEAAIGIVEDLEAKAGVPLPAPMDED